jgi:hypothetical protein
VIAVWDGFMTTTRAMHMVFAMPTTSMASRTYVRILLAYLDLVLRHLPIGFLVLEMTIVQIIDVITVMNWRMPASVTVNMFRTALLAKHNAP